MQIKRSPAAPAPTHCLPRRARTEFDPEDAQPAAYDSKRGRADDESSSSGLSFEADEGLHDAKHRIRPAVDLRGPLYEGRAATRRDLRRMLAGDASSDGEAEGESSSGAGGDECGESGDASECASARGGSAAPDSASRSEASADGVEAELLQLQAQERGMARRLAADRTREVARATHTRNQRALADTALELRIKIQSALQHANRLPALPGQLAAAAAARPAVAAAQGAAREELVGALNDLCTVQAATLQQHADFRAAVPAQPPVFGAGVASFDALRALHASLVPQCLRVLDEWGRKAALAQGAQLKNLRALNRPASEQVAAALADLPRLVRRSQQRIALPRILGEPAAVPAAHAHAAQYCAEVYDDADFYQRQLRALLAAESSLAAGAAGDGDPIALSQDWLARHRRSAARAAERRAVDVRASKGRRLRFDTHAKLLNFMAPLEQAPDEAAAVTLRGLFGYE